MVKVKEEEDDLKRITKSIQEALEVIKVNLADNRKPRRTVPTSRANVWCSRCGENGHYASECYWEPQRQVHYIDPGDKVYYTIPDDRIEAEENLVFRVQPLMEGDVEQLKYWWRPQILIQIDPELIKV